MLMVGGDWYSELARVRAAEAASKLVGYTKKNSPRPVIIATMDSISEESDFQIERKPFETEVHDVMDGAARWEIKVHDHGLVALLDVMPRFAPNGKTRPDSLSCPASPHDAV